MRIRPRFVMACMTLAALFTPSIRAQAETTSWRLTGDLSEACSCSVPCPCNFGESPGPHAFCWALYSLDIHQGHYGDLRLDGLHLAGAAGPKGIVIYVDARADAEQATALRKIAHTFWLSALKANGVKDPKKAPAEFRLLGYKTAPIEQVVGEKGNRLKIGNAGLFESAYIMGLDGKTPIVVENNWSWNIQHGIKGKTRTLRYRDGFGNAFEFKNTNANQGHFDWSDSTPIYFR